MGKRVNGEGTIVKRSDGRYQASLQVNGHRRTVYGRTKAEVAQKLAELKRQASQAGDLPDPGKRTVTDLIAAWLDAVAHDLKPRSMQDYQQTARLYILPELGGVRLSKLTPARVQSLLAKLQRQEKHRAALKAYACLHRACRLAVLWGWLVENPCDRVLRPQYRAPRKEVWTVGELRTFLDGTRDHWLWPLFVLAAATGARLGELLALTWDDADLQSGTLAIRRSLQRVGGEWVIGEPKTRAGMRTIALPLEAIQALRKQKRMQAEMRLKAGGERQDWGLIFTGERGQPLCQSTVQHAVRRACQRLGLPPIGMHGLRHLHASLLLANGLAVPQVAKRLGHATPQVTMSIYAHALDIIDQQAADAVQKALEAR